MANVRKNHTTEFKTKVAVEAIRQQKTINELTTEYGVHATQINLWKKQALAMIPEAFTGKKEKARENQQQDIDELHRQIGQLIAERDWLKKNPWPAISGKAIMGWPARPTVQCPATMQPVGAEPFVPVLLACE